MRHAILHFCAQADAIFRDRAEKYLFIRLMPRAIIIFIILLIRYQYHTERAAIERVSFADIINIYVFIFRHF